MSYFLGLQSLTFVIKVERKPVFMESHETNSVFTKLDNVVKHEGYISKINNNRATVTLKGHINCEACHAKGSCGMAETEAKQIEVEVDQPFKINESVLVSFAKKEGLKAVFWAYVLPFVILITTLIISTYYFEEWLAGLLSLLILVPYYLALSVLGKFFKKAFKISVFKLA